MLGKRHGQSLSTFLLAILAISFHSALAKDKCKSRTHCAQCLKSRKGPGTCAWYVDGETNQGRCISETRCNNENFAGGTCHKSSVTFNFRKTCKRIRKQPSRNDEDGDEPEPPCRSFKGLCTDCLSNGCYWVNESTECVDHCFQAPSDATCAGTVPPLFDFYVPGYEPDPNEVPQMCLDFKLQRLNRELCAKAGEKGCQKCVETQLYTSPDTDGEDGDPPTCEWQPDFQSCYPAGDHGILGPGTDQCDPCPLPHKDTTWPELLGEDYRVARAYLRETYCSLLIIVVGEGESTIGDHRLDRVWLFVNAQDKIVRIPKVG